MATGTQTISPVAWLRTTLLLATGGAAFLYAVLWLAQFLGGLGGRVFEDGWTGILPLGISLLVVGFVSLYLLRWIGRLSFGTAWQVVFLWAVTSLVLAAIGRALGAVSLPIFLGVWAAFGLLLGRPIAGQSGRQATRARGRAPVRASTRAAQRDQTAVTRSSQFGRIPSTTVVLLTEQVGQARGLVLGAVPAAAPREAHDFTIRAVLTHTLTDWWQNGNTAGLTSRDVDDLRSFVVLALALASSGSAGSERLHAPEERAIYRAVLTALLDDWLANWNSDGQDGPPRRP
jgi:hypothetical protein